MTPRYIIHIGPIEDCLHLHPDGPHRGARRTGGAGNLLSDRICERQQQIHAYAAVPRSGARQCRETSRNVRKNQCHGLPYGTAFLRTLRVPQPRCDGNVARPDGSAGFQRGLHLPPLERPAELDLEPVHSGRLEAILSGMLPVPARRQAGQLLSEMDAGTRSRRLGHRLQASVGARSTRCSAAAHW